MTARIGPNPENPTCVCPASDTCWHGDICHSRRIDGNDTDAMPMCYRRKDKVKEDNNTSEPAGALAVTVFTQS